MSSTNEDTLHYQTNWMVKYRSDPKVILCCVSKTAVTSDRSQSCRNRRHQHKENVPEHGQSFAAVLARIDTDLYGTSTYTCTDSKKKKSKDKDEEKHEERLSADGRSSAVTSDRSQSCRNRRHQHKENVPEHGQSFAAVLARIDTDLYGTSTYTCTDSKKKKSKDKDEEKHEETLSADGRSSADLERRPNPKPNCKPKAPLMRKTLRAFKCLKKMYR